MVDRKALITGDGAYLAAAAGRAIISIRDADGEIARLVDSYKCGAAIRPGDSVELADLLELMIANRGLVAQWRKIHAR